MADFTVWDRATLEQFAREATDKMIADRAAIEELVEVLISLCTRIDDEGASPLDWIEYDAAWAAILKHDITKKEQQA